MSGASAAAGREIVVEIESLAPGGDAVGRQRPSPGTAAGADPAEGRVTFVPFAAPGELVRARLDREKGKVGWAELTAIERPGPDRVAPRCPLFGTCGGCQWQHVSTGAQHTAKRAIVSRALAVEVPPVVAASAPYRYRDRAKLAVGAGGALGFRARRAHDVVDLAGAASAVPESAAVPNGVPAGCPLLGPELARALPALRALSPGLAAGVELEVQAGAEGVHLNLVESDATSAAHARREVDRLAAAGVVGLALAGKPSFGLVEVDAAEPGSPRLALPAGGFAQVGRGANAALVAAVLEAAGPTLGTVQELYAGSGNFTRHLVGRAHAVYASDGDPVAVARGKRNAAGATWDRKPQAIDADTVVLDPPREGADRAHLAVAARARRRIVYVSCDPQTLGRDARALAASGFRLTSAVALDLMPQTFHVEVVATFDRA